MQVGCGDAAPEGAGLLLLHSSSSFSSSRKELDGWDPEDDPWAEHAAHAKGASPPITLQPAHPSPSNLHPGKCAFVNLGKKSSELTVADVLGVLEPAKHRMVVAKVAANTNRFLIQLTHIVIFILDTPTRLYYF